LSQENAGVHHPRTLALLKDYQGVDVELSDLFEVHRQLRESF